MASKAKSGLSAVRQFPESVVSPPNSYVDGDPNFISAIRDGKGHSEYHVGVVNNTPFTLQVQHSWRSTGAFTEDQTIASVVDPVSGFSVAEIIAPVTKRFIRVHVTPDAIPPGLGADFEAGIYFQPRASGPVVSSAAGGGGAVVNVSGNQQIQTIEAITLLAAAATFNGGQKDNINYESLSASLTLASAAGTTVTIRFQQRASGALTFRDTDVIVGVAIPAGGALVNFDRVWSITRRFGRIQVENTGANALTTAELVVVQKPIS
jgi:hypothetical protein